MSGGVGGTYGMLVLGWPQRLPCCAEETNSPKRANGCRGPRGSRGGGGCCRAVMEGGGETEWRSPRTVRQLRGRKRVKGRIEEEGGGQLSWLNPTWAHLRCGGRRQDGLLLGPHAWLEEEASSGDLCRPGETLPFCASISLAAPSVRSLSFLHLRLHFPTLCVLPAFLLAFLPSSPHSFLPFPFHPQPHPLHNIPTDLPDTH